MSFLPSPSTAVVLPYLSCRRVVFVSEAAATVTRQARFPYMYGSISVLGRSWRNRGILCRALTEMEPDGNDESVKEKTESQSDASSPGPPSVDSKDELAQTEVLNINGNIENSDQSDAAPDATKKDELAQTEVLNSNGTIENTDGSDVAPDATKPGDDFVGVASGSPLPGTRQRLDEPISIPKATIDILKDQVFGFDTFFVTSQQPYEGGVLFKGNLRGKAAASYEKVTRRLQDKFGDEFKFFLLVNPEDDKPVAVVVPRKSLQPENTAVPEWFAATAFGLVTIGTLLLRNVPVLQSNLLSAFDNPVLLKDGLSGALVSAVVLGSHEIAHFLVANDSGIKLGVPYFVPSWQIGSFGAITRIVSIVRNRQELLKLAAAGPLAGFAVGLVLFLLGFVIPPGDGLGIVIDPSVFHESFLAGGIAKLILGDVLKEGTSISINPLVLWAWSGLLINAINSIPAGELDGGRIAFALFGRKLSYRLSSFTIGVLGISALFSDVAFYWVVLIFILQRGPIAPLSEEITDPDNKYVVAGVAVLLLSLLVCLPYPFPFKTDMLDFDF